MSKVEETLKGCGRFGNSMKFLRKVHPYLHFAGSWWADWNQWQALMATDNGTSAPWYVMLLGQKRVSRADSLTVNRFASMQTPKMHSLEWVSTWWWGDKGESPQECSAEGPAKLLVILGDMFRNAWEWMPCIPYRVSLSITQITCTCPIFEAPSERCCANKIVEFDGHKPFGRVFSSANHEELIWFRDACEEHLSRASGQTGEGEDRMWEWPWPKPSCAVFLVWKNMLFTKHRAQKYMIFPYNLLVKWISLITPSNSRWHTSSQTDAFTVCRSLPLMFENDIINQAHLAHLLDPWRLGVWMGKVADSKDLCPSGVSWDTDFSDVYCTRICESVLGYYSSVPFSLFHPFSMDRLMFESSIFVWGAFEEHLVHFCSFLFTAQQHLFTEVNSDAVNPTQLGGPMRQYQHTLLGKRIGEFKHGGDGMF